ncbi:MULTISPECIES: flavin reductase family protein [unclassified Caballeronia]|uniref:flavin reductase family protein n=1 Tax=unclassified Caballeronia TaxID=2646786 RepID=UPI002864939E|nr:MULTISPECIES: flavin reductase family protein [unclassified Caballeronia]MDR5752617.1 flavin reductase family protein [Caballeronia sp. LZ024]MDR5841624.1 flavin reductase family protein [Caballeronia sp. LZ031]
MKQHRFTNRNGHPVLAEVEGDSPKVPNDDLWRSIKLACKRRLQWAANAMLVPLRLLNYSIETAPHADLTVRVLTGLDEVRPREAASVSPANVDPVLLRQTLGCFATGVTIITTTDAGGEPVGLVANSLTSVSLDPPLVLFCLKRSASTLPAFERGADFAINILHAGQQEDVTKFFAGHPQRWNSDHWRAGETGLPVLEHCIANLECSKYHQLDAGDHVIFIGRVRRVRANMAREPLLYFQGRYRRIDTQA